MGNGNLTSLTKWPDIISTIIVTVQCYLR